MLDSAIIRRVGPGSGMRIRIQSLNQRVVMHLEMMCDMVQEGQVGHERRELRSFPLGDFLTE